MTRLFRIALLACCAGLAGTSCSSRPPATPPPAVEAPEEEAPPDPPGKKSGPWDVQGLTTYELKLAPEDWEALVRNPHTNHWYRGTMCWRGQTIEDVGIRASGQITRVPENPKPSFRVSFSKFKKDQHFHGLSGFKFDSMRADPSMLRERLAYGLYREAGLPAPRETHARLRVNGESKGLYSIEERIGRKFLKKEFGPPVRQLYYWTGQADDLDWLGSNPALYVPDLLRHRDRELPMNGAEIATLVDAIKNKDFAEAAKVFDVEVFLRQLAVEALTGETDGFIGVSTRKETKHIWSSNFFLYKDPRNEKFRIIVWDRDQSFWRPVGTSPTAGFDEHMLTRRLILDHPESLKRFRAIIRELLEGPFAPDRVVARLDAIYREIRTAALADRFKLAGSNDAYQDEVSSLKSYVRTYLTALKKQMAEERN